MIDEPRTEADAIIGAALASAEPKMLIGGKVYVVADPTGGVTQIDLDTDKYRDRPKHKTGRYTTATPDAFCEYVGKHGDDQSEVWADPSSGAIVGVLDAHETDAPGWEQHTVALALVKSPEWLAWTAKDRQWMSQGAFAEHVEDNLLNIIEPTSADMLELAQTFQANSAVRFSQATILKSGERELSFKEDTEAAAGRNGRMTVPDTFKLALRPFLGGDAVAVTARFRYRIREGSLTISYALNQPDVILDDAFTAVVQDVTAAVNATVYLGKPSR